MSILFTIFLMLASGVLGATVGYTSRSPVSETVFQLRDFCEHLTKMLDDSFGPPQLLNNQMVRRSGLSDETLTAIVILRGKLECDLRLSISR